MLGFSGQASRYLGELQPALATAGVALVLFAPTSQAVALTRLRPYWPLAAGFAVMFVAVLLEIGKGQSIEFIYFDF